VPSYTRHQLKEDKFADAAKETVSWAVARRKKLITAALIGVVATGAAAGTWAYFSHRDQLASTEMGRAMRIYGAPLRTPQTPPQPTITSFTTAQERAQAAEKDFLAIAEKYPHTRTGEVARYFVGLTAMQAGETAKAESELKRISGSRNRDLAVLAKFALASLYRGARRDADALRLYKELIDNPSGAVPRATVQLELAAMYEAQQQPAEALRLYEQIRKDDPRGPAAEQASSRIANLKNQ